MATVTVHFEGMCCHIKPPAGPPQRRSVFPNVHDHISYIEVFTNDVDTAANPDFTFIKYTRENASYQRVEVRDVKIELLNITSVSFEELASFGQRVPNLKAVHPQFGDVKATLLQEPIPSTAVASYFDITAGKLLAGPSEHFRTVFEPPKDWPVRHLAQWGQLELQVSDSAPRLRVTPLSNGPARTLVLKDGADLVTIGNQMLDDILGMPNEEGHFLHYYELAAVPPPPPLPDAKKELGLGAGCSNTQWP